jgi:tetratricopeptide (TPR) repeat protein
VKRARAARPAAFLLTGSLMLSGCSTTSAPPSNVSPKATGLLQENPQSHFDHAMELLEQGQAQKADAELHVYLDAIPTSKSARFLIEQIETPVGQLYPKHNFGVRMPKNGSMSSLSKTYLGNALAFYGLARYNGIAIPAEVPEGQMVRIPRTPASLAARRAVAQAPRRNANISDEKTPRGITVNGNTSTAANPARTAVSSGSRTQAENYYLAGLIAFQKQDLDSAIAAWHSALTVEPNFTDAQVHLLEAERLKRSLQEFQK